MSSARHDEFPEGASSPPVGVDRREFLQLAAASAAIATGAGCAKRYEAIAPYVIAPDRWTEATFYATAVPWDGFGRGVIVNSRDGRPTKIEGNPHHSESAGGGTDAVTQAAIRDLYDPDRSRAPRGPGGVSSWEEFQRVWLLRRSQLLEQRGAGWAILSEPTTSPTVLRLRAAWRHRFPEARWFQHAPLGNPALHGHQEELSLDDADVIFAVEGDFLLRHPAAVRYARQFAERRRSQNPLRLYAAEAAWTITGGMADARQPIAPSRLAFLLERVEAAAAGNAATDGRARDLTAEETAFVRRVGGELRRAGARAVCYAGCEQGTAIREWARRMNQKLGSVGGGIRQTAAIRSDGGQGVAALHTALTGGAIHTLCILGANPVYTSAEGIRFAEALRQADLSVHFGEFDDETAEACHWHLPQCHFLESWGDLRGFDGSLVLQQPLIQPMYGGRSLPEVLSLLVDGIPADGHALVRQTHAVQDEVFTTWLNRGVGGPSTPEAAAAGESESGLKPPAEDQGKGAIEVVFRSDPFFRDGRHANNAWLQELRRPFTALVWDNALWISPQTAHREGLVTGDVIRLQADQDEIDAPVVVVPGTAEDCVVAEFGWGRTRAGRTGRGHGFNAFLLRGGNEVWSRRLRWTKTGRQTQLVITQGHFEMEGRDPVHLLREGRGREPAPEPEKSLFPTPPEGVPGTRGVPQHRWGMVIDLSACIGCSACVIACQSENNTPSVGKEQSARGREMHWIRVDRYFTEGYSVPQPVPCMQCERAPCELVCPVGATVHSSEGLNDMVYNRCVGTRYCSNNCPYKVRRFNFLDFRAPAGSPLHLQENPEVTVRERGVMEKCTYCVQRIDLGRIAAERDNRPIRDGDIRTACQQACPADAIVFGDLSDEHSAVSQQRRRTGHYALLEEQNTKPRTTYLARQVLS